MVRVRLAAPADVEDIVRVVMAAMPYDPQWDYRFPRRGKFAEDHYRYTKMLYEHFLDAANDDWRVLVVELTSGEEEGPTVAHQGAPPVPWCMSSVGDGNDDVQSGAQGSKIVAFSVWDVSYIKKRIHGSSYQPQNPSLYIARHGGDTRRDANPARVKASKDSAADSKRHFTKYGRYAIRLQILGTHPAHWRHGYASALCHWGMKIAAEEGLVVQVVAGKMGHKLYTHLNFKTLGEVVKQVPGEEMKVISHAMVFDPKEQARSVASYEGNKAISVAFCVQDTNYGIHEHCQRKDVLKHIGIVHSPMLQFDLRGLRI